MISAKGWSSPEGEVLRRLYDDAGCQRAELAERMGVKLRTLFAWANPSEKRPISFAHYRLLLDITKENADRIKQSAYTDDD